MTNNLKEDCSDIVQCVMLSRVLLLGVNQGQLYMYVYPKQGTGLERLHYIVRQLSDPHSCGSIT